MSDIKCKQERLILLIREEEQLRLEHNEIGRQYREGKITKEEWLEYLKTVFNPESISVAKEKGKLENELAETKSFTLQSVDSNNVEYPVEAITDAQKYHYLIAMMHKLQNTSKDLSDDILYRDVLDRYLEIRKNERKKVNT